MKISLNWLRDYVALDASHDEISRAITFLGFEVEGVVSTGAPKLDNVVVGEILTRAKIPNLKKEISLCTVDVGPAGGVKSIICGAPNCDPGHRVPVALPGAVLPGGFTITQAKKYGHESQGMLCGPDEIGLPAGTGLLLLEGKPALGTPINEILPPGDTVFDLEITPNRPDCQSHLGIARELAAWFKLPLLYPQEKFRGDVSAAAERSDLLYAVRVEAPVDCPLYTAHVITGVKVGPSPDWMQRRLSAVGLRPINNIVDVGNYVMLETGQPLHAFDARKLGGAQIVVRHAAEGETLTTLDGKERTLTSRMLVIADATKPVVIAGIMGGENSGVSADTTDLVLECAIFNRHSTRATSRALGLSSDSSYRYERGVDPHGTLEAAWRAIDLILATAGGSVVGPELKIGGEVPVAARGCRHARLHHGETRLRHSRRRDARGLRFARAHRHARGADDPSRARARVDRLDPELGATTSIARSISSRRCCGCTARRKSPPPSCARPASSATMIRSCASTAA